MRQNFAAENIGPSTGVQFLGLNDLGVPYSWKWLTPANDFNGAKEFPDS